MYLALRLLQIHKSKVERLRKHQIVLMICCITFPIKFGKQDNPNNGNTKNLTLPNRFENLRLKDDSSKYVISEKVINVEPSINTTRICANTKSK